MSGIIIVNIILGICGVLVILALTPPGREKIDQLGSWFATLLPNPEELMHEEGEATSLASQIFYNYNHNKVSAWEHWISKQQKSDRETAMAMLFEHLDGEAKHWGNITTEVLDALKGFNDLGTVQPLCKFFTRTGKLWNEYRVAGTLYAHSAKILYEADPGFAFGIFLAELNPKNLSVDTNSSAKIKSLTDFLSTTEEHGPSFIVEVVNNSMLSSETKQHALNKMSNLEPEKQRELIIRILKPYIENPNLLSRGSTEKVTEYEARIEIVKNLLSKIIVFINQPEVFDLLSDFAKTNKEMLDMVHLQAIKRINSPDASLTQSESLAYYYLPDPEDRLKMSLAQKASLSQVQIREIISKPRIANLTETMLKETNLKDLPVPASVDKQFKKFQGLLGSKKAEIFEEGGVVNGILVYGDDRTKKLYFCKSITNSAQVNFVYYDVSQNNTPILVQSLKQRIQDLERPVVIMLDNFEYIAKVDDPSLEEAFNNLIEDLKLTTREQQSVLVLSTPLTDMEIRKDIALYDKLETLIKRLVSKRMELNADPAFKENIIGNYAKHIDDSDGSFTKFTEELKAELQGDSDIAFEFDCIEELSVQLLIYGKTHSLSEMKKLKEDLFSGPKEPAQNQAQPE